MSEIGVQGLSSGHREEHCAERDQTDHAVAGEKTEPVNWIDGGEDTYVSRDMPNARSSERNEPHQCDRAEQGRDAGRAAGLHGEQCDEDYDGERHDVRLE